MSCSSYDDCRKRENKTLEYPTDVNSLYANRYYDLQTENTRCYQRNPITILEGFGRSGFGQLLKLVLFVLLIILVVSLFSDYLKPKEVIEVGIETPSVIEVSPIKVEGMKGGYL
ncbi:hypothetical protein Klosneuvirus_1_304 [Klosneuvirus KNV1]|uniref:Uncharacterized protein n=1 Tax=Klosneuvirus KNV1 TaxID=1977640 RepID=A0A1V0SIA8_9VIRU|nr:hypothetical protein Klosneuvirus_1_304 [Klosneuvirus KNV1]